MIDLRALAVAVTAAGLLLTAGVQSAVAAEADALKPFSLVYKVQYAGLSAGEADITLAADTGRPGCYRYDTRTRPTGFVKAIYGSPSQSSRFCVEDGRVRSRAYESVLENDDEQSYRLEFDADGKTVTDENGQVRELPGEAVDSFAIQQAVRLWVSRHADDAKPPVAEFLMVDRKNLTSYQLRIVKAETIKTPAGAYETLLLERIDHPNKTGRYWLARTLDWMPVKIETRSGSKPKMVMSLLRAQS